MGWRDFASHVIGEGGRGSALSLAVLYAAVARADAVLPAPRIVRTGVAQVPAHFAFTNTPALRLQRVRRILRAPFQNSQGRTARTLRTKLRTLGIDGRLFGKTGTFEIRQRIDASAREPVRSLSGPVGPDVPPLLDGCGVVDYTDAGVSHAASKTWEAALGSPACERNGLVVTAVHRYPENGAPGAAPAPTGQPAGETFTSFAGVLLPADPTSRSAVVLSVVVDLPGYKTARELRAVDVFKDLVPGLAQWLAYPSTPPTATRRPSAGQAPPAPAPRPPRLPPPSAPPVRPRRVGR
jgi:hypothetical protein